MLKGHVEGTTRFVYARPYLPKDFYKLSLVANLSEKAKKRYKAINLYASGRYNLEQICEIFEISRSTFYRWRKRYRDRILQTLEDKSRRPRRVREKVIRTYEREHLVCEIRRKYPYFGKEKIAKILEREHQKKISASSVGRILSQYKSILPKARVTQKRAKTLKKDRVRIKQIKADMKGVVSEWLQSDTMELNLAFSKVFIFSAIDPVSKILYMRAYRKNNSLNGKDFLLRLAYIHNRKIAYIQIDNGSEFEDHFRRQAEALSITLVHNYPKSPQMNPFVEKVNETIQTEYLDRFYEETSIEEINRILLDCLIEYNFYRPHRSLNLLTPIEYCSQLLHNKDPSMLQMYWTHA